MGKNAREGAPCAGKAEQPSQGGRAETGWKRLRVGTIRLVIKKELLLRSDKAFHKRFRHISSQHNLTA